MAQPEGRGIVFKAEFTFGHVVQIITLLAVASGVWFGLVADVKKNRSDIESNRKAIQEIRADNQRMLEAVNANAERREKRLMGHINEIKGDVSWLVRQWASREGKGE